MSAGVTKLYYNFLLAYSIYQKVAFHTHYLNNTETYFAPLLSVYRIFFLFYGPNSATFISQYHLCDSFDW